MCHLWSHRSWYDSTGHHLSSESRGSGDDLSQYFTLWTSYFLFSFEIGLSPNFQGKYYFAKLQLDPRNRLFTITFLTFQHTTKLEKFTTEFDENKRKIQNAFWEEKRLRIDKVKRDGCGTSSDGNVSWLC